MQAGKKLLQVIAAAVAYKTQVVVLFRAVYNLMWENLAMIKNPIPKDFLMVHLPMPTQTTVGWYFRSNWRPLNFNYINIEYVISY
jgi:hypothetical protein